MNVAKETVWATADGDLVKAGDPEAAVLVASKGHAIPDKKLEQFSKSDVGKFFKDAVFDRAGAMEPSPQLPPQEPLTYSRLETPKATKAASKSEANDAAKAAADLEKKRAAANEGPKPRNRERDMKPRTRKKKK